MPSLENVCPPISAGQHHMLNFMTLASTFCRTLQVSRRHAGAYSGGCVKLSSDGETLACLFGGDVSFLEIESGQVKRTLLKGAITGLEADEEEEEAEGREELVCFALHPNGAEIVTASRNLLLRRVPLPMHWNIGDAKCKRAIRAHEQVVLSMEYESCQRAPCTATSQTLPCCAGVRCAALALCVLPGARTGLSSAYFTLRLNVVCLLSQVWDIEKGYCTHNFMGHTGIVSTVAFHPDPHRLLLASASEDCTVRLWDLTGQSCAAVLGDHMSVPRGLAFTPDGWTLVTAGRDQVLNIWNLRTFKLLSTVPVFEPIEAAVALTDDSLEAPAVDDEASKSALKGESSEGVDAAIQCKCILQLQPPKTPHLKKLASGAEPKPPGYTALLPRAGKGRHELVAVTDDHNFRILQTDQKLRTAKLIVGYNDEIIDIKSIPSPGQESCERRIAVATNSPQIRIFDVDTFSATLLDGHADVVLALDVSPDGKYLSSVSKDQAGMVWPLSAGMLEGTAAPPGPLLVLRGHTDAVGAVCMSRKVGPYSAKSGAFVITGSSDKTLKRYELDGLELARLSISSSSDGDGGAAELPVKRARHSVVAHEKDINAVAVAPNDAMVATASQDKTAKLWRATDLSPVDKCVATCSGDRTVRLWSVSDFTCLKTFQGHTAGVLNCEFVSGGAQLLSGGADGLVKLWTIRTSECEGTFDRHNDRAWAMALIKKTHNKSDGDTAVDNSTASRAGIGGALATVNGDVELITGGADRVLTCIERCFSWCDCTTATDMLALCCCASASSTCGGMSRLSSSKKQFRRQRHYHRKLTGLQYFYYRLSGSCCARSAEAISYRCLHFGNGNAWPKQGLGASLVCPKAHTVGQSGRGGSQGLHTQTNDLHRCFLMQEDLLKEQSLANSLRERNFKRAAALAFELKRPNRLWAVIKDMLAEAEKTAYEAATELCTHFEVYVAGAQENPMLSNACPYFYVRVLKQQLQVSSLPMQELESDELSDAGRESMDALVNHWDEEQIKTCLSYCRDWNTNAKTAAVAQAVITALLRCIGLERLSQVETCSEVLEALLPYSERHYQRLDRLLQSTYLVDYTLAGMRMLLADGQADTAAGDSSSDDEDFHTTAVVHGRVVFNVVPTVGVGANGGAGTAAMDTSDSDATSVEHTDDMDDAASQGDDTASRGEPHASSNGGAGNPHARKETTAASAMQHEQATDGGVGDSIDDVAGGVILAAATAKKPKKKGGKSAAKHAISSGEPEAEDSGEHVTPRQKRQDAPAADQEEEHSTSRRPSARKTPKRSRSVDARDSAHSGTDVDGHVVAPATSSTTAKKSKKRRAVVDADSNISDAGAVRVSKRSNKGELAVMKAAFHPAHGHLVDQFANSLTVPDHLCNMPGDVTFASGMDTRIDQNANLNLPSQLALWLQHQVKKFRAVRDLAELVTTYAGNNLYAELQARLNQLGFRGAELDNDGDVQEGADYLKILDICETVRHLPDGDSDASKRRLLAQLQQLYVETDRTDYQELMSGLFEQFPGDAAARREKRGTLCRACCRSLQSSLLPSPSSSPSRRSSASTARDSHRHAPATKSWTSVATLQCALLKIFRQLDEDGRHIFILVDEIQHFFNDDVSERLRLGYRARQFFKALVSPSQRRNRVAVAVTGSSMIQAWMGFSEASPNGHTLAGARRTLTIPVNTNPAVASTQLRSLTCAAA
ncbi:hypothetical protein JKP88DRAFT_267609 [Tribonema minus]|uniref:U3 small nucleolar RNA-associated protein 13 C-terminal domain-containing protein n=1 Tax=Tribonema minus TaxID=303371 RepID=A0A836CIZ1_9STRA|nr:hypothetical protein JKP88DRAFT_267609 [Tribonema minus]